MPIRDPSVDLECVVLEFLLSTDEFAFFALPSTKSEWAGLEAAVRVRSCDGVAERKQCCDHGSGTYGVRGSKFASPNKSRDYS